MTAAAPCPLLKYRDRLEGAGEPRLVRIYNIRHGTAVARALEMLDELLAHGPVRSVEVRAGAFPLTNWPASFQPGGRTLRRTSNPRPSTSTCAESVG